jgi:hypothetical protein
VLLHLQACSPSVMHASSVVALCLLQMRGLWCKLLLQGRAAMLLSHWLSHVEHAHRLRFKLMLQKVHVRRCWIVSVMDTPQMSTLLMVMLMLMY